MGFKWQPRSRRLQLLGNIMSELNPNIIADIADELNADPEEIKSFLECERGCYTDIRDYNNEGIWMSGQLIARIIAAVT